MRTIVHLSDLHFGKVHRARLEPLAQAVAAIAPDLVAVSGDLTQRARLGQFREAKSFLATLPLPQVVVPGNHDVPLFNLALRFGDPLGRFRRLITYDLTPSFLDDEIAVLGINTTRAFTRKHGRIHERQARQICEDFARASAGQARIVVTHHPFDLPVGARQTDLVRRAEQAMRIFASCGVDLFLSGHLHFSGTGSTARYAIPGYAALVVQAGTATSTRRRGEENSFNLIRIDGLLVHVEHHVWQPSALQFARTETASFRHSKTEGWLPVKD